MLVMINKFAIYISKLDTYILVLLLFKGRCIKQRLLFFYKLILFFLGVKPYLIRELCKET